MTQSLTRDLTNLLGFCPEMTFSVNRACRIKNGSIGPGLRPGSAGDQNHALVF